MIHDNGAAARQQVEYFPGTTEPVPALCTDLEAIRFLRLDDGGRDGPAAERALRRLVDRKLLRPCRVGKKNRYARDELLRAIDYITNLKDHLGS